MVALKDFFSHKDNRTKVIVDKDDGKAEYIMTVDATIVDESGCEYIIASEPLLVATSE